MCEFVFIPKSSNPFETCRCKALINLRCTSPQKRNKVQENWIFLKILSLQHWGDLHKIEKAMSHRENKDISYRYIFKSSARSSTPTNSYAGCMTWAEVQHSTFAFYFQTSCRMQTKKQTKKKQNTYIKQYLRKASKQQEHKCVRSDVSNSAGNNRWDCNRVFCLITSTKKVFSQPCLSDSRMSSNSVIRVQKNVMLSEANKQIIHSFVSLWSRLWLVSLLQNLGNLFIRILHFLA